MANLSIKYRKHLGLPIIPYKYSFIITNKCNSRCKTCNIWKIYLKEPEKAKQELTPGEIIRCIKSIGKHILWLNITGGEPILKEGLIRIVKEAYDFCENLSILNFPVNGLLPQKTYETFSEIASYCKKSDVFVTISLDATGEKHDNIRGVKGAYEKVMHTYSLLSQIESKHKNFHVGFQMTLSKYNLDSALETFNFIKKHGTPIVTFAHEAALFNNQDLDVDIRKDKGRILMILNTIQRRYPLKELKDLMPKIYLKLAKTFLKKGDSPIPCSSGKSTMTIDPYGNVYPCPFVSYKVGNAKDYNCNLKSLLLNIHSRATLKKVDKCRNCWQNCEAFPSIMQHPFKSLLAYFKEELQ